LVGSLGYAFLLQVNENRAEYLELDQVNVVQNFSPSSINIRYQSKILNTLNKLTISFFVNIAASPLFWFSVVQIKNPYFPGRVLQIGSELDQL